MKRIYKYAIPLADRATKIMLPTDAKVVHVGCQESNAGTIWVEANFDAMTIDNEYECLFYVKVTGALIEDSLRYVGTFFDGPWVGHIYVYSPAIGLGV